MPANSTPGLLVFEDTKADRLMLRTLAEQKRLPIEFAWRLLPDGGGSVEAWLKDVSGLDKSHSSLESLLRSQRLVDNLATRRVLIVDLAWSRASEDCASRFMLANLSYADKKTIEKSVEGCALLRWWKDSGQSLCPNTQLIVVSQYVPEVAEGLRSFLQDEYGLQGGKSLFHKWKDNTLLKDHLARIMLS